LKNEKWVKVQFENYFIKFVSITNTEHRMKRFILFVASLMLTITLWGQLYSTTAVVKLRDQASGEGTVITTIPKGTLLTVTDETEGWGKVTYKKNSGYINTSYLKLFNTGNESGSTKSAFNNPSDSAGKIKYYKNSQGVKVQSPTYYSKAPAGATAVCWDGTYSFSKSRRGTCSHHGGVKKWLK
jgi:uncharacterized protein YgiM (DUF1202 family)